MRRGGPVRMALKRTVTRLLCSPTAEFTHDAFARLEGAKKLLRHDAKTKSIVLGQL